MRFSFFLAVVAALTTSMSVSACINQDKLCGTAAGGLTCCRGLHCKTEHFATVNRISAFALQGCLASVPYWDII
ncbi:hypothetical protein EDB19DRAFT_1297532 [Suillus lakei]|nr:hypothetical protein EDB19DRAFT_1297532 [Suillus lakei]